MNLKITLRHMALLFAVVGTTLLSATPSIAYSSPSFTGTVKYRYNALGQRTSKTVNGTTTYYLYDLDGNRIAELDGNGNVTREYIYLNGEPLAQVDNVNTEDEKIYYSHNDHLGAPLMLTDQNQNIVWQAVRTPFGEIVEEDGSGATTQGRSFPGQYYDEETATDYNYYRDYDPALGRYIQSDPIGLAGGINTYAYVGGNPVNLYDFFGLYHCVGGAVCDFSEELQSALQCFDSCTGRDTAITGGKGKRNRENSSHDRGEACDIGRNSNPDLSREKAESCTLKCFPKGYGQEEWNGPKIPGTHFHLQMSPIPGGKPGFAKEIKDYAP